MKITITLPDEIDSWLTDYCRQNGYKKSTYIAFLVQRQKEERLSIGTLGPIADVDSELKKKHYKTIGNAAIETDEFGTPINKQSFSTNKYPQVPSGWAAASPQTVGKRANKYCQHGVAPGGFCIRCVEGK